MSHRIREQLRARRSDFVSARLVDESLEIAARDGLSSAVLFLEDYHIDRFVIARVLGKRGATRAAPLKSTKRVDVGVTVARIKINQKMKFHRGQEFTKKDESRLHCIIQSYVAGELAYLVTYTCSGHSMKVSESELSALYKLSSNIEKREALEHMNKNSESHADDADENGSPLSPDAKAVNG